VGEEPPGAHRAFGLPTDAEVAIRGWLITIERRAGSPSGNTTRAVKIARPSARVASLPSRAGHASFHQKQFNEDSRRKSRPRRRRQRRAQTGDVDGKPAAHRLNVQRHQAAGVSGVVDISDAH
jgi:hypothetical protein